MMKTDNIIVKQKWNKSKEDIWAEEFVDIIDDAPVSVVKLNRRRIWMYTAAAVITLVFLISSAGYLYTKEIIASKGEHLSVVLPDGSQVKLNADSRIRYKPLGWKFARKIKLDGEAYFEVAKGQTFDVISGDATVTVLGTSFNVLARNSRYEVACLTGKVSVNTLSQSVKLTPGMKATFADNRLTTETMSDISDVISWTRNHFVFSKIPLSEVVAEIERQYNIEVVASGMKSDYLYSGNFYRTDDPAQILQIIGKPFGVKFSIK